MDGITHGNRTSSKEEAKTQKDCRILACRPLDGPLDSDFTYFWGLGKAKTHEMYAYLTHFQLAMGTHILAVR